MRDWIKTMCVGGCNLLKYSITQGMNPAYLAYEDFFVPREC